MSDGQRMVGTVRGRRCGVEVYADAGRRDDAGESLASGRRHRIDARRRRVGGRVGHGVVIRRAEVQQEKKRTVGAFRGSFRWQRFSHKADAVPTRPHRSTRLDSGAMPPPTQLPC